MKEIKFQEVLRCDLRSLELSEDLQGFIEGYFDLGSHISYDTLYSCLRDCQDSLSPNHYLQPEIREFKSQLCQLLKNGGLSRTYLFVV